MIGRGRGAPPLRAPWPSGGTPGGAPRPLVIGHRGVRAAAGPPENTLAAFEEAARQGADGIELDVRVCATGELVVLHDPDLARVTGGADGRAVAALAWEELARVDLAGERVPRCADVLALARARGLCVNVEIKRDAPDRGAIVRAAARLVRSWDPAHPVIVSSFDPAMLAAFGVLAPGVPRAQLVHRSRYHVPAALAAPLLGGAAVHLERTIADAARVRMLRRRGQLVNVWTVNDPAEARALAESGVHGLITDAPGRILEAIRR